jgi:hypothetical protein
MQGVFKPITHNQCLNVISRKTFIQGYCHPPGLSRSARNESFTWGYYLAPLGTKVSNYLAPLGTKVSTPVGVGFHRQNLLKHKSPILNRLQYIKL